MCDEDIKAIREWLDSEDHVFSYVHTMEEDGEDVWFVDSGDLEDFLGFLRVSAIDLICIPGKIGTDGVWFSLDDLRNTKFY
jgi:hypothetical protein